MSKHKCLIKKSTNLEIKQRYIPTYVHQPIFVDTPLRPYSARCNPTFYSTVFDTEGYNIKTIHSKQINQTIETNQSPKKVLYQNQTQQNKVSDNQLPNLAYNLSRNQWYDHTKQDMFSAIKNGQNRGYSKERKHLDMSSDPVFTQFAYENKSNQIQTPETLLGHLRKNNLQVKPRQPVQIGEIQQTQNQNQGSQVIQPSSEPQKTFQKTIDCQEIEIKKNNVHQNGKKTGLNNSQQKKGGKNNQQKLTLKGKGVGMRPDNFEKGRSVQQKPTFTVIRKSRIQQY